MCLHAFVCVDQPSDKLLTGRQCFLSACLETFDTTQLISDAVPLNLPQHDALRCQGQTYAALFLSYCHSLTMYMGFILKILTCLNMQLHSSDPRGCFIEIKPDLSVLISGSSTTNTDITISYYCYHCDNCHSSSFFNKKAVNKPLLIQIYSHST